MTILVNPYLFAGPSYSYLFDDVPGAALGVSLRKLSSSYSGNCLQVQRTSDDATLDIGFVNNFLDTAAILSFCGASNGVVSIWYDQSGNGNNLAQSTSAFAPLICTSSAITTNTYNSQKAVYFPDTHGVINLTCVNSLTGVTVSTLFGVGLQSTETRRYLFINFFMFQSPDFAAAFYADDITNRIEMFAGGSVKGDGTTCPINAPLDWQMQFNGASSFYKVNNVPGGALTGNPGSNDIEAISLGHYENTLDRYQEFLIWPSALGSPDRDTIEANINGYYTIY